MRTFKEWWNDEERDPEFWDYAAVALTLFVGIIIGALL